MDSEEYLGTGKVIAEPVAHASGRKDGGTTEAAMTKALLQPGQRRLVDLIQALGFGTIESLVIRGGCPIFDAEPRIVQELKLSSPPEPRSDLGERFTLKQEFLILFGQLERIDAGVVTVEVRHSAPFRIIVERRLSELVNSGSTP